MAFPSLWSGLNDIQGFFARTSLKQAFSVAHAYRVADRTILKDTPLLL
jgi:hypothetical protein